MPAHTANVVAGADVVAGGYLLQYTPPCAIIALKFYSTCIKIAENLVQGLCVILPSFSSSFFSLSVVDRVSMTS